MSIDKHEELDDILKKYLDEDDFETLSEDNDSEELDSKDSKKDEKPKKKATREQVRNRKKAKRERSIIRKERALSLACISVILCGVLFGAYTLIFNQVKKEINLEIGTNLEIADVVSIGSDKASFVSEDELSNLTILGSHVVQVQKGDKIYEVLVNVVDTIDPVAEGVNISLSKALDIRPEQCVTNVSDVTELSYEFVTAIDMTVMDEQKVEILIKDIAENSTKVTSYITLSDDVTAPVIEGFNEIESPLNEGLSYKKIVTVSDDSGEEVTLDIDNSNVDVTTEGVYIVTFTATDHVGNVAVKEVSITIYKKSQSQELVEERAQVIIDDITDASMTDKEKATAIFYWVRENIAYTGTTTRDSWVDGAYAGLFNKAGDCYAYAMTSKILLDTAEIVNMDIEKIPTSSSHFWNLVDVGDGWIHFDTTRRKDGTLICLWDDAKLMQYSDANKNTHKYDVSKYPTIN